MSGEDIFTLFEEDYRRRGVVSRGYKRFVGILKKEDAATKN
ncbi:unnamed protein product [marine sediment metagenome]|uniref:Uncharacterized protein n=1 Tax=marine sediment metagenome TaxID=412755 RepID=X1QJF5_9ZZZZ